MAASLESSQNTGSDLFFDVCCSVCEEDGINKEGLFHCQKCSKTYCDECVIMHNKVLKSHPVTSKCEGDNLPVSTMLDDTLELCEEHRTEKLTMFCEDHEKLLCHVCHLRNHKQCSEVVLLADKLKSSTQRMNVAQMSKTMEQLQKSLQDMVDREKQNKKSLKASYDLVLKEVLDLRRQINDNLDLLQQNTLRELETKHASANASLEDHLQKCLQFISKLKGFGTKLKGNLPPERSFITFRKCLDHTAAADSLLNSMINNNGADMKLLPNSELLQCLADCTDLGKITSRIGEPKHNVDPNKIISIHEKSQYNVHTATDSRESSITGICVTSNGDLVISDFSNCCVKLLNQAYKVIDQVKLSTTPWSMCNISSFEIAVTVSEYYADRGIHFFQADNEKITQIKVLKMNHVCYGIAYHDAGLFVTSGTALYQYTMDGRLVKKLYEDTSITSKGVGMSPDGRSIYVTDSSNGKLLTLTRDGEVTATLQDPAFKLSLYVTCNLHVAATGHVFVFGDKTISQVYVDGKKILNTITLDVPYTGSVYLNEDKRKFLIGVRNNDNIIKFKIKTNLT
ncbi:uncharacterized protein LOC127837007 isoform X2 [Dreissena polymorpha]|uniref:uncharacterized protein LOC127837007 isoform X2 n=1 Tax=Dreissena polymorpha TaxID=45954 RepID=UPI0022656260|nr:uncharacterized protein LOC127837007 isoform X2 [Dreissena polymorpha]